MKDVGFGDLSGHRYWDSVLGMGKQILGFQNKFSVLETDVEIFHLKPCQK